MNSKFIETVTIYEIFMKSRSKDGGLFIYLSPNYNCYIPSNENIILFSFFKIHNKCTVKSKWLGSFGIHIEQMEIKREIWDEFVKLARHFGAVEIPHEMENETE